VDDTDRQIVAFLQEDARQSFKELAHKVGLAASTVYERVRRLERDGVLGACRYEVAPKALGARLQAMIFVQLSTHTVEAFAEFEEHLERVPEVLAFYNLAGRQDFAVHVVARDSEHLQELVLMQFTARAEVDRMETALVFEHRRVGATPDLLR
jgi:DNA-binding Lrp family transcriptional regulator